MDGLTTIFLFQDNANNLVTQSLTRLVFWAMLGLLGAIGAWRQIQSSQSVLDALITVPAAFMLMAAAAVMAVFVDYPAYQTARELLEAYDQHHYQVAEGVVHIIAARPGWTAIEEIQIGQTPLAIGGNASGLGYATLARDGGVLTEGAYARVYYYRDTILRIDANSLTATGKNVPASSRPQAQWGTGTAIPTPSVHWHSLTGPVQLAP
jgi:hypothetical protein